MGAVAFLNKCGCIFVILVALCAFATNYMMK